VSRQNVAEPLLSRYVGREGYYFDLDPGDYYVRARVYRPVLGRWLSVDLIGSEANHYNYVDAAAPNNTDPSGLCYTICCEYHYNVQLAGSSSSSGSNARKISASCPDLLNQKTCCELAAARLGFGGFASQSITPGPCPPAVNIPEVPTLFGPPRRCPELATVSNYPIVNLCSANATGSTGTTVVGTPSQGELPPIIPSPSYGLVSAHACIGGFDQNGAPEVYLCTVYGPRKNVIRFQPAFQRCVDAAIRIMDQACASSHFNRFSQACKALARCYQRYA
jgi:RHS repeat-associated protein